MRDRVVHTWSLLSAVVCSMAIISGCMTTQMITVNPLERSPRIEKVPFRVLLVLTPELCAFTHERDGLVYPLGDALCKYTETVVMDSFTDVIVTSEKNASSGQAIDAIITAKVITVNLSLAMWAWQDREGVLLIEWAVMDRLGNPIWVTTARGVARGEAGSAFTFIARDRELMQKTVDDAFRNSRESLLSSREIRKFAASHK